MPYGACRATRALRSLGLTLPLMTALACSGGAEPSDSNLPSGGGGASPAGGSANPAGGGANPAGGSANPAGGSAGNSTAGTPSTMGGNSPAGAGGSAQSGGASGQGGSSVGGTATSGGSGGNAPVIAAGVRWLGRVDVSAPNAIKFAWSGTGFVGTFTGPTVSVKLRTEGGGEIYFQPVIDGTPGTRFPVAGGDKAYDIATNLAAGEHKVELYRESEGKGFAYSVFTGFAAGTSSTPPAFSGRVIEVVGDSISAGFGNLGSEQHPNGNPDPNGGCPFETKTEAAYQTYGLIAARAVNADASVLAGSGWGIYSDNGGNTQNVMPALFANTVGEQKTPAWSFATKPQAVVINLGTNDSSAHNLTADKFKPAYTAFIATIRSKYPDALILCAVGSMMSGPDRDNAVTYIKEIAAGLATNGDKKVKLLDLGTQDALKGTGCSWHPNVADHVRMAGLLSAELKASLGW